MKKATQFLLKKYKEMSEDRKVRIGLSLSDTVRKVRMQGVKDQKVVLYGN